LGASTTSPQLTKHSTATQPLLLLLLVTVVVQLSKLQLQLAHPSSQGQG
jgi:hypothetical protein